MFGTLGGPELFLIFVVALIVFGPRKLPEIGKSLGKMMAEFRRASNEFRATIENEVEAEKIKDSLRFDVPRLEPGVPAKGPGAFPAMPSSDEPRSQAPEARDTAAGEMSAEGSPVSPPDTVRREPDSKPIEPK
jgi:Tat protein translocase TatB subunit